MQGCEQEPVALQADQTVIRNPAPAAPASPGATLADSMNDCSDTADVLDWLESLFTEPQAAAAAGSLSPEQMSPFVAC